MFSFLKKLFSSEDGRYEAQKRTLTAGTPQQLLALARDEKTSPEILYFLAQNESLEVRKAVAENKSTPVQAAALMAKDREVDVRLVLASRLVDLLPGLSTDKHSQLYAYAVQALGMLAQDEVFQVRQALSTTLRDYAKAPPAVVSRLARDVEREVSEPILRFCVALSDDDLADILSNHPEPWVISTIATRINISDSIAAAIVDTDDIPAISTLLSNVSSAITVQTLNKIVDRAKDYPEWHKPIAMRPEMSVELAHRLAGFVDRTILEVLEKRSDFDAPTRMGIAAIVKRRLEYRREDTPTEAAALRVERFVRENKLTPEVIQDALTWQENEFVILALAVLSAIHPQVVRKMVDLRSARPVVALCWKAKLPMRLAVDVQRHLAKVPPQDILYAKGGTDYPLTDSEIKWQLEFFGVQALRA